MSKEEATRTEKEKAIVSAHLAKEVANTSCKKMEEMVGENFFKTSVFRLRGSQMLYQELPGKLATRRKGKKKLTIHLTFWKMFARV